MADMDIYELTPHSVIVEIMERRELDVMIAYVASSKQVKVEKRGPGRPRKKSLRTDQPIKTVSEYGQFVKLRMCAVKVDMPHLTNQECMAAVAKEWCQVKLTRFSKEDA
jgi:hypothetical protein